VAAIVALVESAYRGEASRAGWTTEADFLDGQRTDAAEVASLIAARDSRIVLAVSGAELLASVHLQRSDHACHLGMFAVRPGLQGRGIGGKMLREAERIARNEWGCREMRMGVISLRTELIAWYERRGYRRSGDFRAFPYGDARYGLPRRDDLRLEILLKALV
jgi:ribosomal protein S18 acetylase RimI-like enzyme